MKGQYRPSCYQGQLDTLDKNHNLESFGDIDFWLLCVFIQFFFMVQVVEWTSGFTYAWQLLYHEQHANLNLTSTERVHISSFSSGYM